MRIPFSRKRPGLAPHDEVLDEALTLLIDATTSARVNLVRLFGVPDLVHQGHAEVVSTVLALTLDVPTRAAQISRRTGMPYPLAEEVALLTAEEFDQLATSYRHAPQDYINHSRTELRRSLNRSHMAATLAEGEIPNDLSDLDAA